MTDRVDSRGAYASPAARWLAALLCVGLSAACSAEPARPTEAPPRSSPAGDIGILHVRGNIYMLVGKYANVTVQVGEQGVLVVDTLPEDESEALLAAIASLSDEPIRYIINTHVHPDHTGGNLALAFAGDGLFKRSFADPSEDRAPVYAHENVLLEMSARDEPPPFEAWPTSTYFTDRKDLFFNGEPVIMYHAPAAHTAGDSIVHFRGTDVISTGDIFITTRYPYIDAASGGTLAGIIDALNWIIDTAVPEELQEGGTLIVPGHGRLCDESEVVEYRDMLTIIRFIVQERINEGMSLAELQASRPTFGWDVRYGADEGFWTTEMFVEAVYNELKGQERQ